MENNEVLITYATFLKIANRYLLTNLSYKDFGRARYDQLLFVKKNGVKDVEDWMTKAKSRLRMYGSHQELAENLYKYACLPGSEFFFRTNFCEPYKTTPHVYYSTDKVPYMYKRDAFKMFLPVSRREMLFDELHLTLPQAMGNLFLRCREGDLFQCVEFTKYNEEDMLEINSEFIQLTSKPTSAQESEWDEVCLPDGPLDLDTMSRAFRKLIPDGLIVEDSSFDMIRMMLKDQLTDETVEEWFYHSVYRCSYIIIQTMQQIINSRPAIFSATIPTRSESDEDPNAPLQLKDIVRVFVDGSERFLIAEEVISDMEMELDLRADRMSDMIRIISYRRFCKLLEELHSPFVPTIIEVPIVRTKHHQIPVPILDGSFGILAADAFFEIMRELILEVQLFQKVNLKNWTAVHTYFCRMLRFFRPDVAAKYFVSDETVKEINENTDIELVDFFNTDVAPIRNAKQDGFTLQNLKNELVHLGLETIFPEIQEYAEEAYRKVVREKAEDVLRTCDLFDAIEHCQLAAFLQRMPEFVAFLHYQRACSRVIYTPCTTCLPRHSQPLLEHQYTLWREIKFMDLPAVAIDSQQNQRPNAFNKKLKLSDTKYFVYNISRIQPPGMKATKSLEQLKVKLVVLDAKDCEKLSAKLNVMSQSKNVAVAVRLWQNQMANLDGILKIIPEKYIYLRTFSSSDVNNERDRRVFANDVIDVLPHLLYLQRSPPKPHMIEKYTKKWATGFGYLTISLTELKMVLELFGINKSNLTLVNDISFMASVDEGLSGEPSFVVAILSPDNVKVLDVTQAVFYIFEHVVCEVSWYSNPCNKHKDCSNKLKKNVMDAIKEYTDLREGTCIPLKHVENVVERLKDCCIFKSKKKEVTPLQEMSKLPDDLHYEFADVKSCETFKVMQLGQLIGLTEEKYMSVMSPPNALRVLYMLIYATTFFVGDDKPLTAVVQQALGFRMSHVEPAEITPPCTRTVSENSSLQRLMDSPALFSLFNRFYEMKENVVEVVDEVEEPVVVEEVVEGVLQEPKRVETPISIKPSEPTPPVEKKKKVVKPPPPPQPPQAPPQPRPEKQAESENCKKCYRTQQRCEEAKAELKGVTNEKKKLEAQLNAVNKKVEVQLNNEWKAKVEELERKHKEELDKVIAEKVLCEEQLTVEQHRVVQLEETVAHLQTSLAAQEKDKVTEVATIMEALKLKDETIKQLEETVSAHSRATEGVMKTSHLTLRDIRNSLLQENPVEQLAHKTRRLIQSTDDANIKNGANLTLLEFRTKYQDYMNVLEQLMENNQSNVTPDVLEALPMFPSLSEGFLVTFERVSKHEISKSGFWPEELNQMNPPEEKELADKECVICLLNMQNRFNTVKCKKCCRRFHKQCAAEWLKGNHTCPTCSMKFEPA